MTPLFIPLKTQYFRSFQAGEKTCEIRKYGPRWNEKVCAPGRPAILSHGYSGARLRSTVTQFETAVAVGNPIYPDETKLAVIHLDLQQPASG